MSSSSLYAPAVASLIDECVVEAARQSGRTDSPGVVVSPYRFNPLGAHIDHQGGSVLARCLDQYTILCFWPSTSRHSTVHACLQEQWERTCFAPTDIQDEHGWDAMARASAAALDNRHTLVRGVEAVVSGTLVSGGLSSSASVILAYLTALADVNDFSLDAADLVELSRQVENDYRGLNNGIQDQMSIAFGKQDHLVLLDVEHVSAQLIPDPESVGDVCFLMCYSGVSRNLGGSPFNTRVAECQQAARLLDADASHLGQVAPGLRHEEALMALPPVLARRARHVYSEMDRVHAGALAWQQGEWHRFGELMNESCHSSIHHYESGSEWLIALHEIATGISGVYGNRFSGGGYGGCLFMLSDRESVEQIAERLMDEYLKRYPDKATLARVLIAESESTVRIIRT